MLENPGKLELVLIEVQSGEYQSGEYYWGGRYRAL